MKELELHKDGEELWAHVEWTPDDAERIEKKEYRFVSPSL
jgi:phage I-like protein